MNEIPPDLFDEDWARSAEKRALREHRRANRWRPSGRPRLGRWARAALVVGIPLVLLWAGFTFLDSGTPASDAAAGPTTSTSVTATLQPTAKIDLTKPYADTPAAMWREGAAGIQLPPTGPVGPYSAEQVTEFMARVKQLIVLSRLDRQVLESRDPGPVLALLAPQLVERLQPDLAPDKVTKTWWISTKIAEGFRLLPVTPRVIGSMVPAINDKGELVVRTNYIVAYAFDAPDPESLRGPMDIVALTRREIEYRLIDDPKYVAAAHGIWFGEVDGFNYAIGCAQGDQGLLAPAYSNPRNTGLPTSHRNEAEYFDPNIPMPTEDRCG